MEHAVALHEKAARPKYRPTIRRCTKGRPNHGRTSFDEYDFKGSIVIYSKTEASVLLEIAFRIHIKRSMASSCQKVYIQLDLPSPMHFA